MCFPGIISKGGFTANRKKCDLTGHECLPSLMLDFQ